MSFFKQKIYSYDENEISSFYNSSENINFSKIGDLNVLQSNAIHLEQNSPYLLHFELDSNTAYNMTITINKSFNDQQIQSQKIYTLKTNASQIVQNISFNIVFTFYDFFDSIDNIYLFFQSHNNKTISNTAIKNCSISKIESQTLDIPENYNINHLAIQANPFTYFILNGEPIRVGKNGLYEIDEIEIDKRIYIAPISPGVAIIDYSYEGIEENTNEEEQENINQEETEENVLI